MKSSQFGARALLWVALIAGVPAAAAERTAFNLRTYFEYDDNVTLISEEPLAPDAVASGGAGLMVNVARTLMRGRGHELRASLTGFHTQPLDDDAYDFDVTGITPRLAFTRHGRVAGKAATLSANVTLRQDWIGGETFSRFVDIGGSWLVSPRANWSIGPSYSLSRREYEADGLAPTLDSRDGLRHTLGVLTQLRWGGTRGRAPARLTLSASAQRNDSDGSNFEFDGAFGTAQLDLPLLPPRPERLFGDLQLQLALSVLDAKYEELNGVPARRDRRFSSTLGASVMLARFGRLDLAYTYLDFGSNRLENTASRNLVRLGLTHSF